MKKPTIKRHQITDAKFKTLKKLQSNGVSATDTAELVGLGVSTVQMLFNHASMDAYREWQRGSNERSKLKMANRIADNTQSLLPLDAVTPVNATDMKNITEIMIAVGHELVQSREITENDVANYIQMHASDYRIIYGINKLSYALIKKHHRKETTEQTEGA